LNENKRRTYHRQNCHMKNYFVVLLLVW